MAAKGWAGEDRRSHGHEALGDAWIHEGEHYMLDRSKVRVDLDVRV